jgi:hypothetical protein
MATHFETNEKIHILAPEEGINYAEPFILVELIKSNDSDAFSQFKIRYGSTNFNEIEQHYWSLKKIITNPILVYNGYLVDITENRNNIHKVFIDYYNNNIKIIEIDEFLSEHEQKAQIKQAQIKQAQLEQIQHDDKMKILNDLVTQRFYELNNTCV